MSDEFRGVAGLPRTILKIEALLTWGAATFAFSLTGAPWWLYAALFFVPDVSFLGYLAGARIGAIAYNALHSHIAPVLLAAVGFALGAQEVLAVAAIWVAHIGFDRTLGYGLKYASGFCDTHLGPVGRKAVAS
ncbi:Domain of unknown function (DUF4260) [Chelatococcus sambhunathii]|nr:MULTISPECIES: DUF4260 domain-containing protein [Chelatococcus]CUA89460.1 Domain of unknown function (DUF4260) [Chelatococcus sambhunathii]